ncbi:MAG: hypothetical protein ABFD96_19150 [Armatimonadia bacterium]
MLVHELQEPWGLLLRGIKASSLVCGRHGCGPVGNALQGAWAILTHGSGFRHGYEIDRVEALKGDEAFVLKGDHGLRIGADRTTEVYSPRREMASPSTYRVPTSVAFSRRPGGLCKLHATCPVEVTFPN